jgi:hypothetical protein
MHNTEDKQWWVIEWAKKEQLFVAQVCPKLGLSATINPAKQHNRYAPDIVVDGQVADLKCQQTPFFKAGMLYNLDPQYVVTFNRKDYLRYQRLYPSIIIYFWLDWHVREMLVGRSSFVVAPLAGVWRAPFAQLAALIEHSKAPLHAYQRRQGDIQGNAKESYLVDVRALECLYRHSAS